MTRFGSLLKKRRARGGFTFADTLVAVGVAATALASFYASTQQATRVLRMGKEVASASEMLQQRMEALRYSPPWSNITTAAGIATVAAVATGVSANFSNVTETFTVQDYTGGNKLVVTRTPAGAFANNGVNLSSSRCVQVTVAATWTGIGGAQRSRQLSTIITKGGL